MTLALAAQQALPSSVIVYSANDGSIRRLILPDTDAQGQIFLKALAPGEAAVATRGPIDQASCLAAVQAIRGVPCASGKCVVVNAGVVVDVAMGDPLIDTHPKGQLVSSGIAAVGDKYDGATFTRLTVTYNTTTKKVLDVSYQPIGKAAAPGTAVAATGPAAANSKAGDAVPLRSVVVV